MITVKGIFIDGLGNGTRYCTCARCGKLEEEDLLRNELCDICYGDVYGEAWV